MGIFTRSRRRNSPKTYLDDRGYYRFTSSGDLVHRWVASKKIGRRLYSREVVHHVNHNKRDNSEENLYICPNQSVHERIHTLDKIYGKGRGLYHLEDSPGIRGVLGNIKDFFESAFWLATVIGSAWILYKILSFLDVI